jgi:agmatinase
MSFGLVQPTFLGLSSSYKNAEVVLIGLPMDDTSSFRPGSRFAPKAIREGSLAIETYSPSLKSDLQDIPLMDMGDLDLVIGRKERAMEQIALATREILSDQKAIIAMGGEHLISLPLIS